MLIINSTGDIEFQAESYLYWIRGKYHTDISTQGYVGISRAPRKRLSEHNRRLSRYETSNGQRYSEGFLDGFKEDDLFFEIVNCGDHRDIQNLEYYLRPSVNIGWNIAIGGEINGVCSQYKHGGVSNLKMYCRFTRILNRCLEKGLLIDPNFKTDAGFKLFMLHLQEETISDETSKVVELYDEEKGFVLGNYYLTELFENSSHSKWLFFNNRWWSKKEACLFTGVNPKTAEKRMRTYGMTREEAVGFVGYTRKNFEVVYLDNVACLYDAGKSNFSKSDLLEMYDFYKTEKRGFKGFCNSKGVDSNNIIRFFKRYGLNTSGDRRFKSVRDIDL